jgi:hypothetical protein
MAINIDLISSEPRYVALLAISLSLAFTYTTISIVQRHRVRHVDVKSRSYSVLSDGKIPAEDLNKGREPGRE